MKAAYKEFPMLLKERADLSGYGFSRGVTDECLDTPLCCMLLLGDGQELYLLITLDTVAISGEFTTEINSVLEREGICRENINIAALHTHSAPGITCFPDDQRPGEPSVKNRHLAESLKEQIAEGVKMLKESMKEVDLWCGEIEVNGCYGNRNRPEGNACKKLYVTKFVTPDGKDVPDVVLANMSCHSTILKADTMKFSSDLAGAVRKNLSELFHCPCMMTIGAAGDVSSRFYVKEHDYQAVLNAGREIAVQVQKMQFEKVMSGKISVSMVPLSANYDPQEDEELLGYMESLRGTDMEFMLGTLEKRRQHGRFDIRTYAEIMRTAAADIIFFPGELVTALGDRIRNSTDRTVIFCCYANDYWQYFVPEEEYGKYFETANSICPKGLADVFAEKIIQELRG